MDASSKDELHKYLERRKDVRAHSFCLPRREPARTLTASFRFDTPAVIGGADPRGAPEIRLPSILGALRFWWRVLAWSRACNALPHGTVGDRIGKVRDWQKSLFGAAGEGREDDRGQGRFVAEIGAGSARPFEIRRPHWGYPNSGFTNGNNLRWDASGIGLGYCAGQGLGGRKAIKPGGWASVTFRLRPDFGGEARVTCFDPGPVVTPPTLADAIVLLTLFGGVGARSRRGFGSISLNGQLEGADPGGSAYVPPATRGGLKTFIRKVFDQIRTSGATDQPPYSAFSRHSIVAIVPPGAGETTMAKAHNARGFDFLHYRSNGFRGRVGGVDIQQNFQPDHTYFNDACAGIPQVNLPRRTVFGLPHNYFSPARDPYPPHPGRDDKHEMSIQLLTRQSSPDLSRRASPCFLSMKSLGDVSCAVWVFLPADFLPPGYQAQVAAKTTRMMKNPTRRPVWVKDTINPHSSRCDFSVPFDENWDAVHRFLKRLEKRKAASLLEIAE